VLLLLLLHALLMLRARCPSVAFFPFASLLALHVFTFFAGHFPALRSTLSSPKESGFTDSARPMHALSPIGPDALDASSGFSFRGSIASSSTSGGGSVGGGSVNGGSGLASTTKSGGGGGGEGGGGGSAAVSTGGLLTAPGLPPPAPRSPGAALAAAAAAAAAALAATVDPGGFPPAGVGDGGSSVGGGRLPSGWGSAPATGSSQSTPRSVVSFEERIPALSQLLSAHGGASTGGSSVTEAATDATATGKAAMASSVDGAQPCTTASAPAGSADDGTQPLTIPEVNGATRQAVGGTVVGGGDFGESGTLSAALPNLSSVSEDGGGDVLPPLDASSHSVLQEAQQRSVRRQRYAEELPMIASPCPSTPGSAPSSTKPAEGGARFDVSTAGFGHEEVPAATVGADPPADSLPVGSTVGPPDKAGAPIDANAGDAEGSGLSSSAPLTVAPTAAATPAAAPTAMSASYTTESLTLSTTEELGPPPGKWPYPGYSTSGGSKGTLVGGGPAPGGAHLQAPFDLPFVASASAMPLPALPPSDAFPSEFLPSLASLAAPSQPALPPPPVTAAAAVAPASPAAAGVPTTAPLPSSPTSSMSDSHTLSVLLTLSMASEAPGQVAVVPEEATAEGGSGSAGRSLLASAVLPPIVAGGSSKRLVPVAARIPAATSSVPAMGTGASAGNGHLLYTAIGAGVSRVGQHEEPGSARRSIGGRTSPSGRILPIVSGLARVGLGAACALPLYDERYLASEAEPWKAPVQHRQSLQGAWTLRTPHRCG